MKRVSVRMVPGIRHFENLLLWIPLRLGLRDRVWKPTNGHSRKLAQLSMTIFSKFWLLVILTVLMAPDRIVLPASRNKSHRKLLTCFLSRVVLGLSFRKREPNLSVQLWRQCFINLWIQTALFPIIAIAATLVVTTTTSTAVIWQSAGWISPIPLRLIISRLYPTTVNKVWCLQCGQIF